MSDDTGLEPEAAEGFTGTVSMVDGYVGADGSWYRAYHGHVRIVSADSIGIRPASGEARWLAEVSGETETVYIPGCKVATVTRTERAEGEVKRVP